MNKIFTGWLLMVCLASCGPAGTIARDTPTVSPLPSLPPTRTQVQVRATAVMSTETPFSEQTVTASLPAPDIDQAQLENIQMMDKDSGWGWAFDRSDRVYLLHTSDGGRTWEDASPGKDLFLGSYSTFMLDAQTAWLVLKDESLVQTADAGQTWREVNPNLKDELVWPFRDWYRLRFTDSRHGWLVAGYTAAGAHEIFYETEDGGATWKTADFETLPQGYVRENSLSEIAFWIDTDVIYFDAERFILAPGDQEGALEMFLSTNWGGSWKTIQLPASRAPEQPFNVYDRKIHAPVFFDAKNGVLAVTIWDGNANATDLSVYGTSDGGLSWSLLGGPVTIANAIIQPGSEVMFLSRRDAALLCGRDLCVTHDSGKSWQRLGFGISIPPDDGHMALQLDFSDPKTGWFLFRRSDEQYLWQSSRLLATQDGGLTWTELAPVINP